MREEEVRDLLVKALYIAQRESEGLRPDPFEDVEVEKVDDTGLSIRFPDGQVFAVEVMQW